jgi:hypothetical protein
VKGTNLTEDEEEDDSKANPGGRDHVREPKTDPCRLPKIGAVTRLALNELVHLQKRLSFLAVAGR